MTTVHMSTQKEEQKDAVPHLNEVVWMWRRGENILRASQTERDLFFSHYKRPTQLISIRTVKFTEKAAVRQSRTKNIIKIVQRT